MSEGKATAATVIAVVIVIALVASSFIGWSILIGKVFGWWEETTTPEKCIVTEQGDATRGRCIEDCSAWSRLRAGEMREFRLSRGEDPREDHRTDPEGWRPLFKPAGTGRHAECYCVDSRGRAESVW